MGKEWDSAKLQAAFDEAGYGDGAEGLFKHFQDFGNAENISPSKYFDVAEYLKAKAEQLNAMEEGVGFEGHQWNEASVLSAIRDAGLSAWDHYTQFGMYEGVNPSNLFDANEYLAMKLASLQAEEPDKNWTEDSMLEAFREAGLNPVEHYFLFGQDEGLPLSPVPDAEKVITDFDPHSPSNPGETFTLANGPEVLDGTAMDDVFNAVAGSTNASRTLDQGDKIDGKGGNDTLNVAMEANFNGFTNDGSMTNVEKVVLTNEGTTVRTFNAKGVSGVETYNLNGKVGLSNVADADVTVNIANVSGAGKTEIGFAADAVSGDADNLTVGLNGVGADAKVWTIIAKDIENATINASGENFAKLDMADVKELHVTGDGSLELDALTAAKLESVDASGATGATDINIGDIKVKNALGGSGDDVIRSTKGLFTKAVINGGDGADVLALSNSFGTAAYEMSNVETLELSGGAQGIFVGESVVGLNDVTMKATESAEGVKLVKMGADSLNFNLIYDGGVTSGTLSSDHSGASNILVGAGDDKKDNATDATLTFNQSSEINVVVENGASFAPSAKIAAANAENGVITAHGDDLNTLILDAAKMNSLRVDTAGDFTFDGSSLSALESLSVNTDGAFRMTDIHLGEIADINLSGIGSVVLHALGSASLAKDITLTANGLISDGGEALALTSATVAGGQSINIDFDLIGAANLGSLEVSGDEGSISVTGSATESVSATSLTAQEVNVDFSNVIGESTFEVTADTFTYTGGLGVNTVTATIAEEATITGGVGADIITVTAEDQDETGDAVRVTLTGGAGGDEFTLTGPGKGHLIATITDFTDGDLLKDWAGAELDSKSAAVEALSTWLDKTVEEDDIDFNEENGNIVYDGNTYLLTNTAVEDGAIMVILQGVDDPTLVFSTTSGGA